MDINKLLDSEFPADNDSTAKVGPRIFFDQDGEVLFIHGSYEGDVNQRKELTSIDYVDVEYGEIDLALDIIEGVNTETKELIIRRIEQPETEEQRRIRELEDALLLQAENEIGGIL